MEKGGPEVVTASWLQSVCQEFLAVRLPAHSQELWSWVPLFWLLQKLNSLTHLLGLHANNADSLADPMRCSPESLL
jgi:hypothetical protein